MGVLYNENLFICFRCWRGLIFFYVLKKWEWILKSCLDWDDCGCSWLKIEGCSDFYYKGYEWLYYGEFIYFRCWNSLLFY